MIAIAFGEMKAKFDPVLLLWSSDDVVLAQMLNDSVDWDEVLAVSTPWEYGPRGTVGVDGVALARAIAVLGEDVEVVEYEVVEPPDEEADRVY